MKMSDYDEYIETSTLTTDYLLETGPGGGHAIYLPIDTPTISGCGQTRSCSMVGMKTERRRQGNCNGNNQVVMLGRGDTLASGETTHLGLPCSS